MLGKKLEQKNNSIAKTANDLYTALGCDRDNFANNILVTRKLQGKSYSGLKEKDILAHKMSISFHPDDNAKLSHRTAFKIAQDFAEQFAHSKGHEVLFAVHTDTKHIHVHFLISNCNMNTGKSYRRNKKDLYEMSEFFGKQCLEYGLTNSVRNSFYNHNLETVKEREGLAEKEMKKRGTETFKDELKEVIQQEIVDPANRNFDDVIKALMKNWNVETRVAGNTISYRHPEYRDKNNTLVSVRGSKLGELFTVKGINYELTKKSKSIAIAAITERGNEPIVRANSLDTRAEFAGQREQVSSGSVVHDIRENLSDLDRFYDRYRKPVKEVERKPVEKPKRTKTLYR